MDAPHRGPRPGWHLIAGLVAFAVWAPLTLVTLPAAALLVTLPEPSPRAWLWAAGLGIVSAALLIPPGDGRLDGVMRAFTVLLAAAFALMPAPSTFTRRALRTILVAGAGTAALVLVVWGGDAWQALAWDERRDVGMTMRFVVEIRPAAVVLYEPVVRIVSAAAPITLALTACVGRGRAGGGPGWLTVGGGASPRTTDAVVIEEGLVTSTH